METNSQNKMGTKKITLTIGTEDKAYDVNSWNFYTSSYLPTREEDDIITDLGLAFSLAEIPNASILNWAAHEPKTLDGKITIINDSNGEVLQTVDFKEGFVTSLSGSATTGEKGYTDYSMNIAAKAIKVNGVQISNTTRQ